MPKKPQIQAELPSGVPEDLVSIATQPHALNALVSELDWRRAQEAAQFAQAEQGIYVSVGDIVRCALSSYLDNHPSAESLLKLATISLRNTKELNDMRTHDK